MFLKIKTTYFLKIRLPSGRYRKTAPYQTGHCQNCLKLFTATSFEDLAKNIRRHNTHFCSANSG